MSRNRTRFSEENTFVRRTVLIRCSTYASELECACMCAFTLQSPSVYLRMAYCYAHNFVLLVS